MRLLRNPIFLICTALFWVTYTLEQLHIFTFSFIHSYLDDLLAMPVILTLAVAGQRQWIYRNSNYILTKFQVSFAVLYVSILFEGVLPAISPEYTRDGWDIIAYLVGAVIFYRFINRPEVLTLR